MSRIDRTLDRLYACGFGVKVIYVVRDPVEVKREFPNDAKYPRVVYATGALVCSSLMVWLFGHAAESLTELSLTATAAGLLHHRRECRSVRDLRARISHSSTSQRDRSRLRSRGSGAGSDLRGLDVCSGLVASLGCTRPGVRLTDRCGHPGQAELT